MNRTVARLLTLLAALVLAAIPAFGDDNQLVTPEGVVHGVHVAIQVSPGEPGPPGEDGSGGSRPTVLLHSLDRPDGTTERREIPGTGGQALEREPFLAMDPEASRLVLAWAHEVGGRFEVAVSSFDGENWTEPSFVSDGLGDDSRPQAIVSSDGVVRVLWRQEDGGGSRFLVRVLGADLAPLGPVEDIVVPAATLDLDGQSGHTEEPFEADHVIIFEVGAPDDPGLALFGVRDVPTPIGGVTRRLDLLLPQTSSVPTGPAVSSVGGSLFVRAQAGDELLYTVQTDPTTWTEFRRIDLNEMDREEAELLIIEQMLVDDQVE